jgi:dipeptidyl aminopeptidase/acylaminoacyl peptidase
MSHQGQSGVYFDSDGYRLLGTLFLARNDNPKPTVVILHGIPGIEKNYDLAINLRSNGWNSLIFHYRGCWGSEGNYTLKTIPADVTKAIDFLCSGELPQVDPTRLYLIGHSLGGWAAIRVAAHDPRIKGVITIAVIADPGEFPFTEEDAALKFSPWLTGLPPVDFVSKWQELAQETLPLQEVSLLSPRPLMILHGLLDELVPVTQSEKLFENAGEPRRLICQDEANHSFVWHRPWLISQILDWLEMC